MKPSIPGRLHALGLVAPRFDHAVDVVRHLTCVQSQLHDMALWSVARRTPGLTLADARAAFERGDFLRTHTMRGTWHFIDPADIHWLLTLTAPRMRQQMSSTNKAIGLSDERLDQCADVIVQMLAAGTPHTRPELAAGLEAAGLLHAGQELAHVVMHTEISALIVSGPMRGKQHTYVPLPPPPILPDREILLAEAATRYARGHGPVRDKDLAWWTGLTLTDSRRAIQLAGLRQMLVDDEQYWALDEPIEAEVPRVMLMSNFDEYISYARDPGDYARFAGTASDVMRGGGLLMIDGRLAGTWTRTISTTAVEIVIDRAAPMGSATRAALDAEAATFGRFVDREPRLVLTT
ncbi:hypothetical protein C6I20_10545 [Aeromicrobium sp. A1-2]|uniref:winged helix DNA-binding domain-containing protein n=1 Tax=Aeromicrobium sp. A1-2 TaxID=2107713 RepID=UPI000E550D1F|nr:winged helix DNA-binding domain-containing protein [Aeromicrobium sp. A1-2]AXT85588.1 hypothetical protein C6I20_10545 [Aeromicrobium sp. A1-2]